MRETGKLRKKAACRCTKVSSDNKTLCFLIVKGKYSSLSNLELYEIIEKLCRDKAIDIAMLVRKDMNRLLNDHVEANH